MAKKVSAAPPAKKTAKKAAKKAAPKAAAPQAASPSKAFAGFTPQMIPGMGDLSKMAKLMTPEQAIELYKANAKLALDVINAAIENTTKLRQLQFEGEGGPCDGQQPLGAPPMRPRPMK
jgi:hypothetical protein